MKQRTFAGRDLNALKMAAIDSRDPVSLTMRISKLAQRELTDAEKQAIIKAANDGNTEDLVRIANELKKSTLVEKAVTFFKAGLLLQPKTHIANFSGNTAFGALETVKDIPATAMDRLITAALSNTGKGTGKVTKDFSFRDLAATSARGAKLGINQAERALRGDPTGLRDLTRWDLGRETHYEGSPVSALANLYTKGVFRTLDAEDRFFRSIAYQRSLEEQARVIAKNEGLKGGALRARSAQLIEAPSDEMVLRSIADSEYAVFQDKSRLAKAALDFRNTFGTPGQYFLPFAKTPANIAARILDYSPIGGLKFLKGAATLLKDPTNLAAQKAAADAFGRSSTGTLALATGYLLAKEGKMTGLYPSNSRTRNEWAATGKQEGSLLGPDDKYYNITRISPLGNLMAIGAQLHEIETNTELSDAEQVIFLATAPLSAITDLPMTATLRDAVQGVTAVATSEPGGSQALARSLGRTAQAAIPGSSLLRGVAYGIDPVVRETRSAELPERIKRQVMTQIPGLSQRLPERIDPLGQTMMRESGLIGSLANPLTPRKSGVGDPVREEIDRLNISIPRLEPREGESGKEFEDRSRVYGVLVNEVLDKAVSSQAMNDLKDMEIAELRNFAEQIGRAGFTEVPDLSGLSDDKIRDRLLRYVYEEMIQKVRSELSGYFPAKTAPGAAGSLLRSLGRN
jgi:hypothetical protein